VKYFIPILLLIVLAAAAFGLGGAPQLPPITVLQSRIAGELNSIDADLAQAAGQIAPLGLTSTATGKVLQKLYDKHSAIIDIATIDLDGNLLLIVPDAYKQAAGTNISQQAHFALIRKTGRPVMSQMFKTVEGFNAAALAYPVIASGETAATGFVSIVFKPDTLMRNIIKDYLQDLPSAEALAIQLDGKVVYDYDIFQVGKMTFSDPGYQAFPSLLLLASKMTQEASGSGTYDYVARSGNKATKSAVWTTISLHGTAWRLMLSEVI